MGSEAGVVHDHMTRAVRDDDLETFKLMSSKTLYSDIPEDLRRYKADSFNDKYKRLAWDDVSRTITAHIAKDGYWYIHPEEHRTLTVREAARIQTFPDWFRFAGARSDAFRQIGNAVPPLLGETAAAALRQTTTKSADQVSVDWSAARQGLAEFARANQAGDLWYMVPGRRVTAPVALVVAVLAGRAKPQQIAEALHAIRGLAKLRVDPLREAATSLTGRSAASLERLHHLGHKKNAWRDPVSIAAMVPLKDSEAELYRLLLGEDLMLRGQGVHRVAARVAGTRSDEVNRHTDGRVDLARLVGGGADAPLRMSAIRIVSMTNCGSVSECGSCVLRRWCATASSRESEPGELAAV